VCFDSLVLGGVDGVVRFLGLEAVHSVVDHLLDGQVFLGDDLPEIADPVRYDGVFPLCQTGF
jgi:hypothetical protein